jgi:PAS domain S-box-containing protein
VTTPTPFETGREIVVVNDDEVQLRVIGDVLRSGGYRVRTYADPEIALSALAEGPRPDALVVDLYMPRIDGWRFCRFLRAGDLPHLADLPILVASATFAGVDVESVTAAFGADGFMEIPFDPEHLVRTVEALIEQRNRRPRRLAVYLGVAEDPPSEELSKVLGGVGYDLVAETGGAGIPDGPAPYVVLVDTRREGAMETIRELAEPQGRSVIVGVSAGMTPETFLDILSAGADAVVNRPIDPLELVDLISDTSTARSLLRIYEVLQTRTAELRSSERRYRSLFESVPEPLLLIDRDGHVLRVNQAASRLLVPIGEEVVGRHFRELVLPRSLTRFADDIDHVWESGFGSFDTTLAGPDGEPREFAVTARIADFGGAPSVLAVARDVTERRRLELRMGQTQKLESLGVLASGLAHDFNNLLASIRGNIGLALGDLSANDPIAPHLREVEVAARRASELTMQILDYSGQRKVSTGPIDLSTLVQEMTRLLEPAVSKKARLDLHTDAMVPALTGNSSQIRQVVMNLITNASDALQGSPGTIRVRTGKQLLTRQILLDRKFLWNEVDEGNYVFIEVSDDGCGMDPETQRRIFDPFFTTKSNGRGLGLAATLGVVRSHGGTVLLDSQPGEGSTFRVFFPSSGAALPRIHSLPRERRLKLGAAGEAITGTVLVVDDDASVRRVVVELLHRAGFDVLDADCGPAAIELVRGTDRRIDLVVVDLLMPDLDGVETLAELRHLRPGLRALVSSGYAADDVMNRVEADEHARFLGKPYDPEVLIDEVRAAIGGSMTTASAIAAGD